MSRRGEKAEMNPEPHLFSYIRIEENISNSVAQAALELG